MFVGKVAHSGNGFQILADKRAQDTRSCSVKDTHTRHADEDSIINEIGDGLQRFVATHATDINVLLEM